MLIRLKVRLPEAIGPSWRRDEFWREAERLDLRSSPAQIENGIKERWAPRLEDELLAIVSSSHGSAPSATKSLWRKVTGKPSDIKVTVLSLHYGSLVVLAHLAGAKLIAAALGTDALGVSGLVESTATDVMRELLRDFAGDRFIDAADISSDASTGPDDDTADQPTSETKTVARGASLLGAGLLLVIALLAIAWSAINTYLTEEGKFRSDMLASMQALFAAAGEHAKTVDQLEVELIKARTGLLKVDSDERTQMHKLLIDAVNRPKSGSHTDHEGGSDRTELIVWPPSIACCPTAFCGPPPPASKVRTKRECPAPSTTTKTSTVPSAQ